MTRTTIMVNSVLKSHPVCLIHVMSCVRPTLPAGVNIRALVRCEVLLWAYLTYHSWCSVLEIVCCTSIPIFSNWGILAIFSCNVQISIMEMKIDILVVNRWFICKETAQSCQTFKLWFLAFVYCWIKEFKFEVPMFSG